MTMLSSRVEPPGEAPYDDVPRTLLRKPPRADRVFNGLLAGSSTIVLVLLAGLSVYLLWFGLPALREAKFGLFTDKAWNPDAHEFGMLPLLVGSIAIATLAVAIAAPVSLATALMINEYGPRRLKPWLTGVIVSNLQAAPAKWLVNHVGFVPILRTPSSGRYVQSVFACGLVCSVTIIPIITSVSREVMAQAPRDVCEASLGLGGTRWGMVTEVILPFGRNGILGAMLMGFGRGLGETMIVVLVLSPANHLTPSLLGPGGLGSIALQITADFTTSTPIAQSALILLGLILFITTMGVNVAARLVVQRANFGGPS
jgi:phosphate transport system permease protein